MNIVIIEDEKPAVEKLQQQLQQFPGQLQVVAVLSSVKEAVKWFKKNSLPDIILLDIELSDGISLEMFNQVEIKCPLIFTTAFDEYLLEAFEYNGIDYLLKPIKQERLNASLNKFYKLKTYFTNNYSAFALQHLNNEKTKSRYIVKRGSEYISLKTNDIAYFFSEHKVSFLIDKQGQKYVVDKTLAQLEDELNTKEFFRINRKYISNITAIHKFKQHHKGKVLVELNPLVHEDVIVSQENAAEFKKWLEN